MKKKICVTLITSLLIIILLCSLTACGLFGTQTSNQGSNSNENSNNNDNSKPKEPIGTTMQKIGTLDGRAYTYSLGQFTYCSDYIDSAIVYNVQLMYTENNNQLTIIATSSNSALTAMIYLDENIVTVFSTIPNVQSLYMSTVKSFRYASTNYYEYWEEKMYNFNLNKNYSDALQDWAIYGAPAYDALFYWTNQRLIVSGFEETLSLLGFPLNYRDDVTSSYDPESHVADHVHHVGEWSCSKCGKNVYQELFDAVKSNATGVDGTSFTIEHEISTNVFISATTYNDHVSFSLINLNSGRASGLSIYKTKYILTNYVASVNGSYKSLGGRITMPSSIVTGTSASYVNLYKSLTITSNTFSTSDDTVNAIIALSSELNELMMYVNNLLLPNIAPELTLANFGFTDYSGEKIYRVNYVLDDATIFATRYIKDGNTCQPTADPKKSGYKFIGWYKNNSEYSFDTPVKSDLTLVAMWEKEE